MDGIILLWCFYLRDNMCDVAWVQYSNYHTSMNKILGISIFEKKLGVYVSTSVMNHSRHKWRSTVPIHLTVPSGSSVANVTLIESWPISASQQRSVILDWKGHMKNDSSSTIAPNYRQKVNLLGLRKSYFLLCYPNTIPTNPALI